MIGGHRLGRGKQVAREAAKDLRATAFLSEHLEPQDIKVQRCDQQDQYTHDLVLFGKRVVGEDQLAQAFFQNMRVDFGRGKIRMAQQRLY